MAPKWHLFLFPAITPWPTWNRLAPTFRFRAFLGTILVDFSLILGAPWRSVAKSPRWRKNGISFCFATFLVTDLQASAAADYNTFPSTPRQPPLETSPSAPRCTAGLRMVARKRFVEPCPGARFDDSWIDLCTFSIFYRIRDLDIFCKIWR